ncbi:hypothetical protein K9L97_01085 [Candidatus Woesearchaeota archaeon]|nr:hypothetical protein [Candidatus Woesearchaeota archaeon]
MDNNIRKSIENLSTNLIDIHFIIVGNGNNIKAQYPSLKSSILKLSDLAESTSNINEELDALIEKHEKIFLILIDKENSLKKLLDILENISSDNSAKDLIDAKTQLKLVREEISLFSKEYNRITKILKESYESIKNKQGINPSNHKKTVEILEQDYNKSAKKLTLSAANAHEYISRFLRNAKN